MPEREFPILHFGLEHLDKDEQLGTKNKYWLCKDREHWLFKENRDNTGEDWSEKLAAEFARLIGIPAATVELAEYNGMRGAVSLRFLDPAKGAVLIHGNEVLSGQLKNYDRDKRQGQSDHTLQNIHRALRGVFPQRELHDPVFEQLVSYLVLDALVLNTDRHHENWGLSLEPVVGDTERAFRLQMQVAPSYDHASSLGRELLDKRRDQYVRQNLVSMYVRRGAGAIFLAPSDGRGANPLDLIEFGVAHFSRYFQPALRCLDAVKLDQLTALVDRVPDERMSQSAKLFTRALVSYTFENLCKLKK